MSQSNSKAGLLFIPLAVALVAGLLWTQFGSDDKSQPDVERPDFASFTDVKAKKRAFFNYMLPFVRHENKAISADRQRLEAALENLIVNRANSPGEIKFISALADRYRMKEFSTDAVSDLNELLARVDTIPASLALAQAANESAWGTSRFARDGNNFFGIWCWSNDCGLTPKKRDAGAKHEVTAFDSPGDSVRFYLYTLNSHPAYAQLRALRANQRSKRLPVTGLMLAGGLEAYSERGHEYVEEIRAMIRFNKLQRFAANAGKATPSP